MRNTSLVTLILLLCFITLAAQPASAQQLINLNFTGTAYSGTTETSPATPTGPAGTWNNLTNGTVNGTDSYETDSVAVLLSDGNTGPTLTFDATSSGSGSTWNATSLSLPTVNYTTAGGVYDVANLYESGLVNGGNATTGFRIKGLTPGNYDVYLVPMFRGAQAAGVKADAAVTFSIGLGNDTDARNAGNVTPLTSTAANPTQNIDTRLTSWVAATDGSAAYNYIGATVTIDSTTRWLTFLLQDSATTGPDRAGPSVIQIRSTSAPVDYLGDFNENDKVDAADYVLWRENEGQMLDLPNDGLGLVMIDSTQYGIWATHFGDGTGGAFTASLYNSAVPEPCTLLIAILTAATMWGRSRLRRQ